MKTEERNRLIYEAWKAGKSAKEISEEFHCTPSTVNYIRESYKALLAMRKTLITVIFWKRRQGAMITERLSASGLHSTGSVTSTSCSTVLPTTLLRLLNSQPSEARVSVSCVSSGTPLLVRSRRSRISVLRRGTSLSG